MTVAVPFPATQPPGYEWFDNEPIFDPERHLALEQPATTTSLVELGYSRDEIANKATEFAVSAPFRVLSDEGAAVMLDTARRLRAFHVSAGNRIERVTRGGCYRSKWLRDLCLNPEVTAHLSKIYDVEIAAHPMPVHLGHLNFEPSDVAQTVDKWHHDTIALDFVMMVTDPALVHGGHFEWFHGTKTEAAALSQQGQTPPEDRRVAPEFPGPGYAIALHGDMVVHRGAALTEPCERITMVNAYVAADTSRDEQSRSIDLIGIDDPTLLYAEWAKFAAWRSAGRLQTIVDTLDFSADADAVADSLDAAIADAQRAARQMREGRSGDQLTYE